MFSTLRGTKFKRKIINEGEMLSAKSKFEVKVIDPSQLSLVNKFEFSKQSAL